MEPSARRECIWPQPSPRLADCYRSACRHLAGLLELGPRQKLTLAKRSYAEIDSIDASITQFDDQSLEP
jgi:hypothetical protein